jgi:hypothetical protein
MGTDKLQIRRRNTRNAYLVVRPRKEAGESGCERHLASSAKTSRDAHHVLFRDKTFGEPVGKFFVELIRVVEFFVSPSIATMR